MNENLKEVKKGALNKLGEHLMTVLIVSVIVPVGTIFVIWGKEIWTWWQGFHLSPELVSRIEHGLVVGVIGAAVFLFFLLVARFVFGLKNRVKQLEAALNQQNEETFKAPENLSTRPRSTTDSTGRHIDHPSQLSFHVLKLFAQINSMGALNVQSIAYRCQISEDEARSCLKELRELGFIHCIMTAPGEWNGQYGITPQGRQYVERFAT